MTIITADRSGIRGCNGSTIPATLKLAPLALAAMLLSAECHADWKLTPNVDLRETYTDNVGLQRDDVSHNAFVSQLSPGFNLTANGPRLTLSAEAQWNQYAYSDNNAPNLTNSSRRYQATGRAMVVDDFLYVDASAGRQRQATSAFGPLSDNQFSNTNRTDISTWRISPYAVHRFGTTATGTVRFTRDSVDGGERNAFGSSVSSASSVDLVSGTAFTDLGWNVSYFRQNESNEIAGDSSSSTATLGARYRVLSHLNLTATAGYDDYDYAALGGRTAGRSWTAGFAWAPSARTSVEASFGHRYFGKTGSLASSYRTRNTVWSLNYSDQVTTTRSQFLLPAAIDTAAMLDRMFATNYPDPLQRQQVVQAYIAATGLPPTLANSINYLSNRYIRAKRLQGAAVFRGARSSMTLSVFASESNALSIQQSDSALLGSQAASLNDNVRQHGGSIDGEYRLSPRMTASGGFYLTNNESITTGLVNNTRQVRVALARRFDARTTGTVELRHGSGNVGGFNEDVYHENAIAAALSVRF
jgi:uncharacterized protein (PEP-CTERM system associated)